MEKQEVEPRVTYLNMNKTYSNQSGIQVTENDITLLFGANIINEDGEHVVNMDSFIRMSHEHFEKFVNNCNDTLTFLKKELNAK